MNYQQHFDSLQVLIGEAETISGSWDGDLPGIGEDRAHAADEIIAKADEIKDLLAYLRDN